METDASPVTSNVASIVTASSTFNVPSTVVIAPGEATVTDPPPVANEVSPDESNVETDASPVTSNVPVTPALPPIEASPNTETEANVDAPAPKVPVTVAEAKVEAPALKAPVTMAEAKVEAPAPKVPVTVAEAKVEAPADSSSNVTLSVVPTGCPIDTSPEALIATPVPASK